MNTNKLDALAASDIEVTNSNNIVTIGNEYIEREFSTVDNKLKTTSIEINVLKQRLNQRQAAKNLLLKQLKSKKMLQLYRHLIVMVGQRQLIVFITHQDQVMDQHKIY